MKTWSLMIMSLLIISVSLIAVGCGGSGGGSRAFCACNYNQDMDNDGVGDSEYCIEATCSGSGCLPCNCKAEGTDGDQVSSCNGTKSGSTTVTEENLTGEVTCFAINDGGAALCAMLASGGLGQ